MNRLIILFLVVIFPFNGIYSQIKISTKFALSTFQDVGLELSSPIGEKNILYANMDYRFQSFYFVSTGFLSSKLVSSFENNGVTIRLGIKRIYQKNKNNKIKNLGITGIVFYRRFVGERDFKSFNLFSSNNSYKIRYEYQDIGFSLSREREYSKAMSYYINLGFGIRKQSDLRLNDYTTKDKLRSIVVFDLGIRLSLYTIN